MKHRSRKHRKNRRRAEFAADVAVDAVETAEASWSVLQILGFPFRVLARVVLD
ncbi:hypothetical protein [Actinocorallia longicatena]|uniref:Uncharacterized protein n=1 Tax=Actinocorallia longicatena TaxID=111803 RepID=A0ABP6QKW8_9ACTN